MLECRTRADGLKLLEAGPHDATPNEEWEIMKAENGTYKIKNRLYGSVIDLVGAETSDGAPIMVSENLRYDGGNQRWRLIEERPKLYSIRSLITNKSLEIQSFAGKYTGRIQQWSYYGANNQTWKIQRIPNVIGGVHFIENEFIRLGVDADKGGAIFWISEAGSNRNVVNTKDLGRYIQPAYYAGEKRDRTNGGQSSHWRNFPWNPLQAGDYFGNKSIVMDLRVNEAGDVLYVKTTPLLWDMNGEVANAHMETWIKLDGPDIEYHGKLTRFEGDDIWGIKSHPQELPACYLTSDLKHFYSYTGSDVWNYHLNTIPSKKIWEKWETHESWISCVDDSLWGFSVYFPGVATFSGGYYRGEDDLDTTAYIAPKIEMTIEPFGEAEFRCYFSVGPLNELMHRIYLRHHRLELLAQQVTVSLEP